MLISSKLPPYDKLKKDVWRDVYLMRAQRDLRREKVLLEKDADGRLYPRGEITA